MPDHYRLKRVLGGLQTSAQKHIVSNHEKYVKKRLHSSVHNRLQSAFYKLYADVDC